MNRSKMLMGVAATAFLAGGYFLGIHQGQAGAQAAGADGGKDKRVLTTSGTATTRVKPDSARVFFRVETYAPQVQEARLENGRIAQKIMKAVKALKIDNLKMKSDNLNVTIITNQHRISAGELPKILGYHIVNSFTVLAESNDARTLGENAARVLDTALENGATGVERVVFFKKEMKELQRQLMTRAVEEAMANARALARGADEKIKESTTIAETPRYYFGGQALTNTMQNASFPVQAEGTPIVAGDLELSCHVSITCRY